MAEKRALARTAKNPVPHSYKRLLDDVIGLVETGRTTAGRIVNQTITAT